MMKKIKIHIYTGIILCDERVSITINLPSKPSKNDLVFLSKDSILELERQAKMLSEYQSYYKSNHLSFEMCMYVEEVCMYENDEYIHIELRE
ncbi:hypothetical protein PG637_02245 [Riemerella anatipestifer]|nr:hypothetical protein [Riemerella anatipestifer]MDY3353302.1 hypothetical protein [Riemerella anatipestifer]